MHSFAFFEAHGCAFWASGRRLSAGIRLLEHRAHVRLLEHRVHVSFRPPGELKKTIGEWDGVGSGDGEEEPASREEEPRATGLETDPDTIKLRGPASRRARGRPNFRTPYGESSSRQRRWR